MNGVVVSGGLCPGLNCIIHELTKHHKSKNIIGFIGGYKGIYDRNYSALKESDTMGYRNKGGCFIKSSRVDFDSSKLADNINEIGIHKLYVIGGNGSLSGAHLLARSLTNTKVVGIPKTIDNDIPGIEYSFGFFSAVEKTRACIESIETECEVYNAIGIVQVMGRQSGFIAHYSSLSSGNVDITLLPEEPFNLIQFVENVRSVYAKKRRCLIVVSEGLGKNIGEVLYQTLRLEFPAVPFKYLDPSYYVRTTNPCSYDIVHCCTLAYNAFVCSKSDVCVSKDALVPLSDIYAKTKYLY